MPKIPCPMPMSEGAFRQILDETLAHQCVYALTTVCFPPKESPLPHQLPADDELPISYAPSVILCENVKNLL